MSARSSLHGDLRAALDKLFTGGAPARRIVDVATRPLPYASSFAIDELDVRFDDGSSLALVCKGTGDAAMLPEAHRIKPGFLFNPLREIATYQWILDPLGIGAPQFYGSSIDEHRDRYWLFLERVNGAPLTEVGDFSVWRQVSAWLARMHCRVARDPALACATAVVPFVQYDSTRCRVWIERARHYLLDEGSSRSRRVRFAWLASRYDAVLDAISTLPRGFVHGEFFASNVLVEPTASTLQIRPIDWELAGIGPMLIDLAALTAGHWTEAERTELAMSYHGALDPQSDAWLRPDTLLHALDCCRVQLAMQQLGWAQQWTPPATHTFDWLGDALGAAERLGLGTARGSFV